LLAQSLQLGGVLGGLNGGHGHGYAAIGSIALQVLLSSGENLAVVVLVLQPPSVASFGVLPRA